MTATLERILKDILRLIKPLREDRSTRSQIIVELQTVVQSVETLTGATVEPFGSYVSDLYTRWGDLDVSIELPNGSDISSAGRKRKQELLGDLLRALRRTGGWHKLQLIAHARVPILKLERTTANISCDISINNLKGQMKSRLLHWINEIDGRFREMVLLVKEWAKAHNINDPKSGTLNSYTLSLLVIFHFQTCAPALLPPLEEIYPGNLADDLRGGRAAAERHIKETCAENITKFRLNSSRKRNPSSLSVLFILFLEKFFDINSRALEQGICLYTGQWEALDSNDRWPSNKYALYVEDPFERPDNSARAVGNKQLTRISQAFQATHSVLTSGSHNKRYFVGTLLRPEVSQFLERIPLINPSGFHRGGYVRTSPQSHRAVHVPSQVQHQHQNTRTVWVDHSNNLTVQTTRTANQGHSQRGRRPRYAK